MSRDFRIISIFIYLIIIFPLVFLPVGFDYSIFYVGGKILANGGKLYVDFIDIKPPLLYYTFGLLYLTLKNNMFLHQIVCNLILFLTAVTLFEIAYLVFRNKWVSFFAPIIYILFIASFNYNYINEPELVFSFFFCIITLLIFRNPNNIIYTIVLGILSGLAFGLKYSFGIIILPVVGYFFYTCPKEKKIKQIVLYLTSFFLISILPFLVLYFQNGTLKDFFTILDFINYYQGTALFSEKSLKRITNNLETIIGVHYSLLFSLAFFYGSWKTLQNLEKNPKISEKPNHYFLLFSFFSIFFSIIVEHQFLNYHFIRISTILSIYSAIGFYYIFNETKELSRKIRYFIYVAAIFLILFLTPLPRYVRTAIPTYLYFANFEKYIDYFENKSTANTLLRQHTTIANFINQKITRNDTVAIIGGAAQIYTMLKDCYVSAFPTSVFILSNYTKPIEWEERFYKELNTSKFLVIQDFDHTHFFGREVSSWEAFNQNRKYKKILDDRYELVLKTFSFYVFERRK